MEMINKYDYIKGEYDNGVCYTALPNNIVWSADENEEIAIHTMSEKIIPIMHYLNLMKNRLNYSVFTLEQMITFCGLVPKSSKGKSVDQFKDILKVLIEKEVITHMNIENLDDVKQNTLLQVACNLDVETNFFPLNHSDFTKIMNLDTKDKLTTLTIYCYFLARLRRRAGNEEIKEENGWTNGGHAESVYDTLDRMAKDLHINKDTLSKHISTLQELNLLFADNIGLVKKKDSVRMANNVYTVRESEMEYALEESKYYYIENGYTLIGKKTDEEVRTLNGLKGRIKQLQEQGIETKKLDKKYENMIKESKKLNKMKEYIDIKEDEVVVDEDNHKQIKNDEEIREMRSSMKSEYQIEKERKEEARLDVSLSLSGFYHDEEEFNKQFDNWEEEVSDINEANKLKDKIRDICSDFIDNDKCDEIIYKWNRINCTTLRAETNITKLRELKHRLDEEMKAQWNVLATSLGTEKIQF